MVILKTIKTYLHSFVEFIESFGIIGAILAPALSTAIPLVPLFPLAGANFENYRFIGVLFTYIGVVVGMFFIFLITKYYLNKLVDKLLQAYNLKLYYHILNWIKKKTMLEKIIIIGFPFTPTLLLVLACGLNKMLIKDFTKISLLSAFGITLFNTYIGNTLFNFMDRPKSAIFTIILSIFLVIIVRKIFYPKQSKEKKLFQN